MHVDLDHSGCGHLHAGSMHVELDHGGCGHLQAGSKYQHHGGPSLVFCAANAAILEVHQEQEGTELETFVIISDEII